MCGICGIVALGRPPEREAVERMSHTLVHQGPDGSGSYAGEEGVALGFRRLAIIDLSDAASQPFASDDGELQLVYNGEVYNYRELRRELEGHGHRFRSASDTEVVLRSYEQWGEGCVERFDGMWAFALWDRRRRLLFCSRDRFGIKPFYYAKRGDAFFFASEPKAFRGVLPLIPNPPAVHAFLEHGELDRGAETFLQGVERLPPAHNLVFGTEGARLRRYWSLEPGDPVPGDPAEAVRETFLEALRLHLRSDVPVGTCLSGGIDSSSIVVGVDHLLRTEHDTASAVGDRQQTFTAYFTEPGCDEREFAQAVVAQTNVAPHWITFDDADLVAALPTVVEGQDEPFGSTSMLAQWFVMREARRAGLTVMLDGQGGDEVFAGYDDYVGPYLADLLRDGRLPRFVRDARAFATSPRALAVQVARPFLHDRMRGRRTDTLLANPELGERPERPPFPGTLRSMLDHMRKNELPKLLRYEDRNSMAHSLEARVPFLDVKLVELAATLSGDLLLREGETKSVLRAALADLLPATVRRRRDKVGFVTPERRFFTGALGTLAAEVFASPEFGARGFTDDVKARRLLTAAQAGSLVDTQPVWRALNLELWVRRFCDA